nr:rrna biogenesis protein rrp36 [Quercus suber]
MAPSRALERNIRPKRRLDDEDESDVKETFEEDENVPSEDDQSTDGDDGEVNPSDNSDDPSIQPEEMIRNVSFGALRKAQEVLLSKKRKRDDDPVQDTKDAKLEALRTRLRQIKDEKAKNTHGQPSKSGAKHAAPRPRATATQAADEDEDEDDTEHDSGSDAPSEEGAASSRTSKHAPMSQTTRHQVTRKRTVISVPKRVVRDPRFDALSQRHTHPGDTDKAYAFLREYQEAEIRELGAAVAASRNEDEKETLRRRMMGMQNRLRAKDAQEREQAVRRGHRKEEREKVLQGKTPFYLKRKDIKERALVERYKGMKGKEREKAIEKKRKKEGQKEKRRMPEARRRV